METLGHDHDDHEKNAGAAGSGNSGGKLLVSIVITGAVLVAEVVGGLLTGSLALLSDAAHVFLDMFALALGYGAIRLAAAPPSSRHTYGFRRMKVLAAFANGATLVVVAIEILREAVSRFAHPSPVNAGPMLIVAVIGLAANLVVVLVLRRHDHDDLNARAAFLHVLGDALSSVGVIGAGIVLLLTGWSWVDPAVSLFIGLIILAGAWRVLREAIHILNEGAPTGAEAEGVSAELAKVPGVREVHDLHVWTIEPGYSVLSAHVLIENRLLSDNVEVMAGLKDVASRRFGIEHTTIQLECDNCGQGTVACVADEAEGTPRG